MKAGWDEYTAGCLKSYWVMILKRLIVELYLLIKAGYQAQRPVNFDSRYKPILVH